MTKAQNGVPVVPSSAEPIVMNGTFVTPVWLRFFNNLIGSSQPILSVIPTGSPFSYTAAARGSLSVSGGTVAGVTLNRAGTIIQATSSMVPVMNGDVVTVTYSVAPILSFIPS